MGNTNDKNKDRGRPLGGGGGGTADTVNTSDNTAAREARSKLVKEKNITSSELQRKERILNIVENDGKSAHDLTDYHTHQQTQKPIKKSPSPGENANETSPNSSVYMSEPGTREAIAAEQRLAMKQKKSKQVNIEDRRTKTKELLFGDGLKEKEFVPNTSTNGYSSNEDTTETATTTKRTENDITIASGKAAESALNRVKAKGNHGASQERKERTALLIHGDLLKDENASQASLRSIQPEDTPEGRKAQVEQALRNLQNCNSHTQVPATAKLLTKIITNIISAETLSDQEKFGKLRLANPKIKQSFLDLNGGLECLIALGFEKQTIETETNVLEDYMIFDFSRIDRECLWHAVHLIDLYYPQTENAKTE